MAIISAMAGVASIVDNRINEGKESYDGEKAAAAMCNWLFKHVRTVSHQGSSVNCALQGLLWVGKDRAGQAA